MGVSRREVKLTYGLLQGEKGEFSPNKPALMRQCGNYVSGRELDSWSSSVKEELVRHGCYPRQGRGLGLEHHKAARLQSCRYIVRNVNTSRE